MSRIPLPGNMIDTLMAGVKTGSGAYANAMHPIIEREKQKQLEAHFQEQLKLQKAAAGRAGANSDLNRQILQQQLLGLQHKNDPNYEFNQFKALQNMITGGGQQGDAQIPGIQQQPMPTQEEGEGMGMFSPQGMQEAQQAPQQMPQDQSQGQVGMNFDALRQNPMLRGFFKHKFGYDPLAEAPQTVAEKEASALDLFKKKQEIKQGAVGDKVPLTTAMKTKLQGVVTGVDNALPVVKELIDNFKNLPTGIETINPAAYAAYNAKANSIIEPLINAFGLNVTDATKDMMHEQVFRKTNEPLKKYKNRLVDLAKEIIRRRDDSFKGLKTGSINPKSEFTNDSFEALKDNPANKYAHMSDEELHKIAGGG